MEGFPVLREAEKGRSETKRTLREGIEGVGRKRTEERGGEKNNGIIDKAKFCEKESERESVRVEEILGLAERRAEK